LNTAIAGFSAELRASSWIDMLAGLSYWKIRKVPPAFCAIAGDASAMMNNPAPAMTTIFKRRNNLFTGASSRRGPRPVIL